VLDDARHYLQARNLSGNHCTLEAPSDLLGMPQTNGNGTNGIHTNGTNGSQNLFAPSLQTSDPKFPKLLVWSAGDEKGIARLVTAYSEYFASHKQTLNYKFLENLAFTLNSRRSSLPWKSFMVANLASISTNLGEAMSKPVQTPATKPRLGFVFTGQGAQWHAMGREAIAYHEFLESLTQSDYCLTQLGCRWKVLGK
jgi:acyl transferase domain-containing protein